MKQSVRALGFFALLAFNPLSCGSSTKDEPQPAAPAPRAGSGDGGSGGTQTNPSTTPTPTATMVATPTPDLPPIGGKIAWSDVVKPIEDKCLKCHKSTGKRPLDKPSLAWPGQTRSEVLSAIANALNNSTMPPANQPQLTDAEKSVLLKWVDDGGPE